MTCLRALAALIVLAAASAAGAGNTGEGARLPEPRSAQESDGNGSCPPGTLQHVAGPEPRSTEFGMAGLVIDKPGCYLLTQDLVLPPSLLFGVLIVTDRVTLDLNGFAISAGSALNAVRAIEPVSVTVRNGTLRGGRDGIVALGSLEDRDRRKTSLKIEGMSIELGASSTFNALLTFDVDHIEILATTARGIDNAIIVRGRTTGRIVNSSIDAVEGGFVAADFFGGEIRDSYFSGDGALVIGANNHVTGNIIEGGPFGFAAIWLRSDSNRLMENTIDARRAEYAVMLDGSKNVLEENFIRLGFTAGISIAGSENRIARNLITQSMTGVDAGGSRNSIVENMIVQVDCGLRFRNGDGHIHRDNVILDAGQGICGTNEKHQGKVER